MGKRKGSYYKKKGFRGISANVVKKMKLGAAATPEEDTASRRKLSSQHSPTHRLLCAENPPTLPDPEPENENIIVNKRLLGKALEEFKGHSCPEAFLQIDEADQQRNGLCSTLVLRCSICKMEHTFRTSPNVAGGAGQSAAINRRSVLGAMEVGLGREALADLCAYMNLPAPVNSKSFQDHLNHLHTTSSETADQQMAEAGQRVREMVVAENPELEEEEVLDVAVSYDGTWHKRGFVSNHGVGVVISMDSGEVLDREVLSKVCRECKLKEGWDRDTEEYRNWWEGHKDNCLGGHKGSSGKMEVDAAVAIWGRSVDKHRLRYKYMVSDGDSKAFKAVEETYGEGHKVEKLDCVGHVGKRMFNHLDKFRKSDSHSQEFRKLLNKRGAGRGAGCLHGNADEGTVGRLSKLYRTTIRKASKGIIRNSEEKARATQDLQRAVLAILYHSCKVDDEIRHQYCPNDDWCEYRKHGKMEDKDHHLDGRLLEPLLPVFQRLSDESLLSRCLPGYTQNQNEAFNQLIWKRCPKHVWRTAKVVHIAVNMAVMAFNSGAEIGRHRLLQSLNLSMGAHALLSARRKDKARISNADNRAREANKKKREAIRQGNKEREEGYVEEEGVLYEAGGF
ncbi:uncharacterized protein [Diadema setosum]|uniref:uncharacterized protein n=1 Tax=Diadema setosum TaxID=31175 RepID=UPI003B3AF819